MPSSENQTIHSFSLPPITEILLGQLIMGSLIIILLPVPSWYLDIMFGCNLVFSLVVLLVSFYVTRPSEFTSLPSIVLIGFFMRTAFSIAVIRYILVRCHLFHPSQFPIADFNLDMGVSPFTAFSLYLGGGHLLVGIAIICCLFLMGLAFTVGIKMLTSSHTKPSKGFVEGQTTVETALDDQCRRSLNGASWLLLIEAFAGVILITLLIGILEWARVHGTELGIQQTAELTQALFYYFELGAEELLIRQIPILLMALSIGVVVCRSAHQPKSLGPVIFQEIQNKPYAVLFAGAFTAMLATSGLFGSGLHWWVFLPLANCLGGIAFSVFLAQDVQMQLKNVHLLQSQITDQENLYASHSVPILCLEVPERLIPELILNPTKYPKSTLWKNSIRSRTSVMPVTPEFQVQLFLMKRQLFETLGYIIPPIEIQPSKNPDNMQLRFLVQGIPVLTEDIAQHTASDDLTSLNLELHIPAIQEALILQVHNILTRQQVQQMIDNALQEDANLRQEILARLDLRSLRYILAELIHDRVSIRNLRFVIEHLCDYSQATLDPETLVLKLKADLS